MREFKCGVIAPNFLSKFLLVKMLEKSLMKADFKSENQKICITTINKKLQSTKIVCEQSLLSNCIFGIIIIVLIKKSQDCAISL